jgi:hypothetical protein
MVIRLPKLCLYWNSWLSLTTSILRYYYFTCYLYVPTFLTYDLHALLAVELGLAPGALLPFHFIIIYIYFIYYLQLYVYYLFQQSSIFLIHYTYSHKQISLLLNLLLTYIIFGFIVYLISAIVFGIHHAFIFNSVLILHDELGNSIFVLQVICYFSLLFFSSASLRQL